MILKNLAVSKIPSAIYSGEFSSKLLVHIKQQHFLDLKKQEGQVHIIKHSIACYTTIQGF